jgi:hypothetical protein
MTYTCPKCKYNNLLADEVVFHYGNKVRYCKQCKNTEQSLRRNNIDRKDEHKKYQKNYHLTKTYGITIEQYNNKLELQLNGCAICKQPCPTGKKLAVDHNHKTNQLRDLLCIRCNNILGLAKDSEELLFSLIEYLKRHSSNLARIA